MILLDKIYSEEGLFDQVIFHHGVNIILGKYSKREQGKENLGNDNGVGKSTLVRLIDFGLLGESVAKEHFDLSRHRFLKDCSSTLVFHSEGKNYQVTRNFNTPNFPYFSETGKSPVRYEIENLRAIFGELFIVPPLQIEHYDTKWFRDLMHFFVKDDVNTHERSNPLMFVHRNKRTFQNYFYNELLMGIPFYSTFAFDSLSRERESLQDERNKQNKKLKDDTGMTIEQLSSELVQLEKRISILQKGIDEFKMFETYDQVGQELKEISSQISLLYEKYRERNKKLEEYQNSYKYEIEVDEERIKRFYSEISETLSEFVKRSLNEVINFRRDLSENRRKFVKENEDEISREIQLLKQEIIQKEQVRTKLYTILDSKGELYNLKTFYEHLSNERSRKERIDFQISEIQKLEVQLSFNNTRVTETIAEIGKEINERSNQIKSLIELFHEIIRNAVPDADRGSIFDIRPRYNLTSPIVITVSVPKEEALGNTRYKLVAYDLTLFLNMIRNNFNYPRFLIHDGVFHSISLKTVIRTLNYVEESRVKFGDFQYIITANEEEVVKTPEDRQKYGDYKFDLGKAIIAAYEDSKEGTIFKGIE